MGKITGLNPAIILLISFHLGFTNGNAWHDHSFTAYYFAAFLLPTIHHERKDIAYISGLGARHNPTDNQEKAENKRKII